MHMSLWPRSTSERIRERPARALLFGIVLLVAWVPGLVALAMLLTGHAG
jgi:hypothetical protein